jgi:hypothetical protein
MKFTITIKYYCVSFAVAALCWGILSLANIEFINVIFFLTAFTWHFALMTPGLKEKVIKNHHKLSFLSVIVRANHYLQMFINLKKINFSSSLVRAISPAIFTFLLFMVGGNGNILFTLLGSFCFELSFLLVKFKTSLYKELDFSLSGHTSDQDIPPAIPSEGNNHE